MAAQSKKASSKDNKPKVSVITPPKETNIKAQKSLKRGVFIIIFLGLLFSGAYFYWSIYYLPKTNSSDQVVVIEENKPTATPQEKPEISRGDLSISVLNGSGVSGAAGALQSYLKKLGYGEVSTGNADAFDYENLTVSLIKEKEVFLGTLKADLSDRYKINGEIKIVESQNTDIEIILGK